MIRVEGAAVVYDVLNNELSVLKHKFTRCVTDKTNYFFSFLFYPEGKSNVSAKHQCASDSMQRQSFPESGRIDSIGQEDLVWEQDTLDK